MHLSTQSPTIEIANYAAGKWLRPSSVDSLPVLNPATNEVLAQVPLSSAAEVGAVIEAAEAAFPAWRRTPPEERIQYLFKLKQLLEENLEDLARTITRENGKTLTESRAELRRGIEN